MRERVQGASARDHKRLNICALNGLYCLCARNRARMTCSTRLRNFYGRVRDEPARFVDALISFLLLTTTHITRGPGPRDGRFLLVCMYLRSGMKVHNLLIRRKTPNQTHTEYIVLYMYLNVNFFVVNVRTRLF